jgi:hypothetical protein
MRGKDAPVVTVAEGGGASGGGSIREPAVASWPSGRRRKTKGWGPRVSEGEGRAGLSRLGGQGPGGWAENLS